MATLDYKLLILLSLITQLCVVSGKVVTLATPVLFTNNDGGGVDEIQVPNGAQTTRLYCTGSTVFSAWYTPYDNIYDLSAIATINVDPSGNCAQLLVGGYSDPRNGRVRIRIYADIDA